MKKLVTIQLIILLFLGISESRAQENSAVPENVVTVEEAAPQTYADSLNARKKTAIRERVEQYIDNTMEQIPHRSFWDRARASMHSGFFRAIDFALPDSWKEQARSVIDIIFDVPLLVLLLLLGFVFIFNVFLVSLILILVSFYKQARESYQVRLNAQLEDTFTRFLFYDLPEEEAIAELSKVNTDLGKTLLIDIFVNYQRNLSGEYRDRILALYEKLELYKISEKRTRSIHTYKRVKGIRELANMYPAKAKEFILKFVQDKNDRVRTEAQIAYAYLDSEASFDFLDNLDQPLSTWAQLNILNHVKLHERQVPSFSRWIDSPNEDVEIFSIRMMDYFQQSENAEQIIHKLDHASETVRNYAYKAIRHLNLLEAKAIVQGKYAEETYENKIEILRATAELGDESDLEFLKPMLKEDGIQLKILACKAIYSIGPAGKEFLAEYSETDDVELQNYIEHIKDQRN